MKQNIKQRILFRKYTESCAQRLFFWENMPCNPQKSKNERAPYPSSHQSIATTQKKSVTVFAFSKKKRPRNGFGRILSLHETIGFLSFLWWKEHLLLCCLLFCILLFPLWLSTHFWPQKQSLLTLHTFTADCSKSRRWLFRRWVLRVLESLTRSSKPRKHL